MGQAAAKTAVPEEAEATTPTAPKTLAQKLLGVMERVTYIQKRGKNDFHGYKYATEADVADAVRQGLIAEGLILVPSFLSRSSRDITTAKGRTETVTSVRMKYIVRDVDSGDELHFEMEGDGQDPGDKGVFKAITGCTKYALMKLFHIPTGDDPEGDSKTDETAAERAPAPKITEGEAELLMTAIAAAGISLDRVCKSYRVKSLVELDTEQAAEAWTKLKERTNG